MMGRATHSPRLMATAVGCFVLAALVGLVVPWDLGAEYGDIIMNREAEKAEMPPVVFPHWFHRIRFKCKVCHDDIFVMKAGANEVTMIKIIKGEFCGKCHNGRIAWAPLYCDRCHSGKSQFTIAPSQGGGALP